MRTALFFTASAALASVSQGLNILITNDDGFGTSNIRELYKAVKAYGHNAYIVASATDMSGMGGRAVFTTSANLTTDSEFGIVKAGAPSIGTDPNDNHIWYYNGTPSSQVFTALDYILPDFANFSTPDLVLSGPNFGLNAGPFFYTLSGTIGATYAAIERGIPAIAYSAAYSVHTPYHDLNASTKAGLLDPATITGRLAANLAQGLVEKANGSRILPLGYGLSVNIPYITSFSNTSCVNPPFILSRQTGGAAVDKAVYNASTGLLTYQNTVPVGANTCINGDCGLPGETDVVSSGCKASVSVFTVDYDAPSRTECGNLTSPYDLVPMIVQLNNASNLVGGLGANANVAGGGAEGSGSNATVTVSSLTATGSSPTAMGTLAPTTTAMAAAIRGEVSFVALVFGLVAAGATLQII